MRSRESFTAMRGYALIQLKITEWTRDKMECLVRTTRETDRVPLWVLYMTAISLNRLLL